MSATATATALAFTSTPNSPKLTHFITRNTNLIVFNSTLLPTCRISSSLKLQSLNHFFFRIPHQHGSLRRPSKPFSSPVMEWQDCTVKMEVDVPASVAYKCYSDREAIPRWMPFISSVKILEDKPDLSEWTLKYKAFGRDIEYSWLARNMQPIPNQKIHWRSMEGLGNRGAVRFFPKGPSSCLIELTVSYEVPQLLVPVASALQPFLESLLRRGLERFATFVTTY
ncbi:hypothetical protein Dsin_025675 [Dipteronia sinensis]|uniref:Coenzyme Q-binding protein COQ10 START domain-containing protein n=1 Tax=Dipteronia sinensis TaxID=43782 RepID=A0AAD9ZWJ7_9ROSI|nr:hypothetical protein Dsin_025675 [Dipteronia sinensis]